MCTVGGKGNPIIYVLLSKFKFALQLFLWYSTYMKNIEYTSFKGVLIPNNELTHRMWLDRFKMAKETALELLAEIEASEESPYERTFMCGRHGTTSGYMWTVSHPTSLIADRIMHRIDGPAAMDEYGKDWYLAGFHHREDGPAIEKNYDAEDEWFLWGVRVWCYAELQELTKCADEDIVLFKLKYGEM